MAVFCTSGRTEDHEHCRHFARTLPSRCRPAQRIGRRIAGHDPPGSKTPASATTRQLLHAAGQATAALGVEMGSYTHRANSFHVYERDYSMFDGYIRRIESGADICFNYAGEWDELMDEAKPEIAEMVRLQKEKL